MQIQIRFRKLASGLIQVALQVTNTKDYPTRNIFKGSWDYPAEDNYELGSWETDTIITRVKTTDEAREWADRQIEALMIQLHSWRNKTMPEDYEIEI